MPFIGLVTYLLIIGSFAFIKWIQAQADKVMLKKHISILKKIDPKMTPKEIEKAEESFNGSSQLIPAWYEFGVGYVVCCIIGLVVLLIIMFFRVY